jgi:AcrR family transcriptional regulator
MRGRREDLIEKSLNYMLEHGVAGLTLRPLAGKIGTSARLLVYHFGSKDGLITAVMDEVRARIQRSFADVLAGPCNRRGKGEMHAFWAWTIHPANLRSMRLLFEVQVLAIQDPAKYARYLEGTSSSWLEVIEASLPPSKNNRAIATLCAAVIDGLLLEYMSTGDAWRTTKALNLFTRLMAEKVQEA